MKDVGIVGLPQSGKTTLFNALTRAGAPAGGAAGRASVAAVPVADPRVDVLAELERSRKKVFVQARFVDVAGLSAGAGGGLSAQGLGALREADALAMVLAAWDGSGPDPVEAAAELTLELTVADLESVAGGADKAAKKARAGVKDAALEADVLARARDLLDRGTPLRAADWEAEEARVLRNFAPLTLKPALAVLNLAEAEAAAAADRAAEAEAKLGLPTVAVAAALEAEAAELPPGDAADLLAGYGVERGGLDQVVGAAWRLLELLTFLTTGEDETRAWEVRRGATAPEAAGRIHSDLQQGFIRAEVIGYGGGGRPGWVRGRPPAAHSALGGPDGPIWIGGVTGPCGAGGAGSGAGRVTSCPSSRVMTRATVIRRLLPTRWAVARSPGSDRSRIFLSSCSSTSSSSAACGRPGGRRIWQMP
jgi:GTP-binding protein YchF